MNASDLLTLGLTRAIDDIGAVTRLVDAIGMAAEAIDEDCDRSAIRELVEVVRSRINKVYSDLDKLRPDPFALGGVDPLIALGAEQLRVIARHNAPDRGDITEAETEELTQIEDQLCALVPTSAAGAAVLVRLLQYRGSAFAWGEPDDQITNNLLAWLERAAQP